MNLPTCSLSITVARTDIPFMMQTIPHLVRSCQFEFVERVLFLETAPLSSLFRHRPGIGSFEDLRDRANQLLQMGIIDRIVEIDYSMSIRKPLYQKYFGRLLRETHNHRGAPIYGYMFSLEQVKGDYVLHFDSDMLLHQEPQFSWIQEAVNVFEQDPSIVFVSPLSGPPTPDGSLKQRGVEYQHDPRGFYRFKDFTSRKFLVDRRRLAQLLPLKPEWLSWKRRLLSYYTKKSALQNFEIMVSNRMKETEYIRADLSSSQAWTVHPADHGAAFIQALPQIIQRVEAGRYPSEQVGDYDLQLEAWL
ncbi:hypothetical protein ACQ4M3_16340 [Leptolyngbya sp. AN03gr2]|uniref:hypothetical protein n=1 Tax=unclassified Leptolyngbya TaxID=2650499 RepID=UPI003D30F01E